MQVVIKLIDELENRQKIVSTGIMIIEELDKTVEFLKSSVYNIEKKIPGLVGKNIPDMDKAENDFTRKPVKSDKRRDPEQ